MSNIRGRVDRLEKEIGPDKPTFPLWEIVAGVVDQGQWLASQGFPDPLAALRAGVTGPGLGYAALVWWLGNYGYSGACDRATAEAIENLPPELKNELHWLPEDASGENPVEKRIRLLRETPTPGENQ
jgi:hypothetical protein